MIRVTVTKDGEPFVTLSLPKEDLIVGRGGEADVQLTSEAVSRRHARLQRVAGRWQVADLGAANGVYVERAGRGEPERIVIHPLEPGDRIHIETFVIELEELEEEGEAASEPELPSHGFDDEERSLETNRTQFISMVDVLAARQGTSDVPSVTGPIMRFVSEEGGPVLEHGAVEHGAVEHGAVEHGASGQSAPLPAAASETASPASATTTATRPAGTAAVSRASASNAWLARMTSPSGHERNFTLTAAKVNVGSAEACEIRLPSGPGVIVELERAGNEVVFRRVPLWPFPRVIVGGRAEKRGYLSDGESFLVGEYEVTVHLRRGG